MGYRTLRACLNDLEATGQLVRIEQEIDPHLEAAEIQRRVFRAGGPAVYFARVKGCRFPMVSNLFGTMERVRFIFRDSLDARAAAGRAARPIPARLPGGRWRIARPAAGAVAHAAAARVAAGRCWRSETTIDQLAAVASRGPTTAGRSSRCRRSTPKTPTGPGWRHSNLGMYRVQLSGGQYRAEPRKSGCTIRFIAASACIMRRRCAAASRCGSTSSSAAPPAMTRGRRDAAARGHAANWRSPACWAGGACR